MTHLGAETFKSIVYFAKLSKCIRVKYNQWKVIRPKDSFKNLKDMILPKFKTVEMVTISEYNQMKYTCLYCNV